MRNKGRRTRKETGISSIVPAGEVSGRLSIMILVAVVIVFASSCGYRTTPVGGIVPENAKTIAIPVFINSTNEPYVDVEITRAVVEEFLTDGRLQVVSLEAADIVLLGRVVRFDLTPMSYTVDSYVQQYMATISVNVSIEEAKSHKVLWQETGLSTVFVSTYPVSIGNITATKIVKDGAIKNACKDVASTLRSRVLEGF